MPHSPPSPTFPDPPITALLQELRGGDGTAMERLLPLVYDELRRIAGRELRRLEPGHTLSATALVHEAYLKLAGNAATDWRDRAHFYGVAARAMRQVLVDHARRHRTAKRGGDWSRVPLEEGNFSVDGQADLLVALDEALTQLSARSERLGRVVECRFFAGLTEEETAEALHVTSRTVRRDWIKARSWLYGALYEGGG